MSTDTDMHAAKDWTGHTVTLEHTFTAPRQIVWDAWTDSRHLAQWWGPDHFTAPVCDLELRIGGSLRIDMLGPDGQIYPMTGVVTELDPPQRLAFRSTALDNAGTPLFDIQNTIGFADDGAHTHLTLEARVLTTYGENAGMYLSGMEAGWSQSLGKLDRLLPELVVTARGSHSE